MEVKRMEEKKGGSGRAWTLAGMSFIACILLGTGIGLLLNRPDVGAVIGVGVGFLLLALIGTRILEAPPVAIGLPRSLGRILLSVVGALMIVCGIFLLYNVDLLYPWVAGIAVIVVGVVFFLGGLLGTRKTEQSE